MNPFAKSAEPVSPSNEVDSFEPFASTSEIAVEPSFDEGRWVEGRAEERGAGGRQVLGITLAILAALWLAFSAWSAGRSLGGQPISSPAFAQWVAIVAGPLALLGLAWLMFGRTRRQPGNVEGDAPQPRCLRSSAETALFSGKASGRIWRTDAAVASAAVLTRSLALIRLPP